MRLKTLKTLHLHQLDIPNKFNEPYHLNIIVIIFFIFKHKLNICRTK